MAASSVLSRIFLVTLATLALSSPVYALKGSLRENTAPNEVQDQRELDATYTRPPSKQPTPPTHLPTPSPTRIPTAYPTARPTPTDVGNGPPEICGTIPYGDGSGLILGDYEEPSWQREANDFDCNLKRSGHWFYATGYGISQQYVFSLTRKCEYQFSGPETNQTMVDLRDVNSLFEQMAISLRRPFNVGYKASSDDIVFSGWQVPDYDDDVEDYDIPECPENHCVKISGPAVTRRSLGASYPMSSDDDGNTENLSILYAFSDSQAWADFKWNFWLATISSNKEKIFHTNHFLRCGCENFCMEDDKHWDSVPVPATCYTEELCGQRVFQIQYKNTYPTNEYASWASTGTTEPLVWFDECAKAMYGCTQIGDYNMSKYGGTYDNWSSGSYKGFPRTYSYATFDTNGLPQLTRVGNGWNPYDFFPLGLCQGDCDNDSECQVSDV